MIDLQHKSSCDKWRKGVTVDGGKYEVVCPGKCLLQKVYDGKSCLILTMCMYFLFLHKNVEIVAIGGAQKLGHGGTMSACT